MQREQRSGERFRSGLLGVAWPRLQRVFPTGQVGQIEILQASLSARSLGAWNISPALR